MMPKTELPEIELSEVVDDLETTLPGADETHDELAIDIDLSSPTVATPAPPPAIVTLPHIDESSIDIDLGFDDVPVLPQVGDVEEPAPVSVTTVVAKPQAPSLDMDALFGDLGGESELVADLGTGADDALAEFPSLEAQLAVDTGVDMSPPASLDADTGTDALTDTLPGEPAEDAPALPLSDDEPAAIPAIKVQDLEPDLQMIDTLKRLAGPGGDPDKARVALIAALRGASYDPRELPDARAIAVGIARALTQSGFSVDQLVDAIMDVLAE